MKRDMTASGRSGIVDRISVVNALEVLENLHGNGPMSLNRVLVKDDCVEMEGETEDSVCMVTTHDSGEINVEWFTYCGWEDDELPDD